MEISSGGSEETYCGGVDVKVRHIEPISKITTENTDQEIEIVNEEQKQSCYTWCPNWKVFTLQFSLTAGDMGTDINNAWTHFQNCNYVYCALTLLFVVLQSLPSLTTFLI